MRAGLTPPNLFPGHWGRRVESTELEGSETSDLSDMALRLEKINPLLQNLLVY